MCKLQADGMLTAVQNEGQPAYDMMGTVVDDPVWHAPPESLL